MKNRGNASILTNTVVVHERKIHTYLKQISVSAKEVKTVILQSEIW